MSRRILAPTIAIGLILAAVGLAQAQTAPVRYREFSTAGVAQNQYVVPRANTGCLERRSGSYSGTVQRVLVPEGQTFASCTPVTTTTVPPTTIPPTTVPTTTLPPTTTVPPTTVPPSGGFVETFDAGTGLDRFDTGVFHRPDGPPDTSKQWDGDHDLACGGADTSRPLTASDPSKLFYLCRDHLMTSLGHVSTYSVLWFSPKQVFTTQRTVSWDVNVTDLGARQWWEVALTPAAWRSGVESCPQCSSIDWVPSGVPYYPTGSVVVGNGPFGGGFHVHANGQDFNPASWQGSCGQWALDPEGCASKAIRRTFTITDNGNNTLTLQAFGQTYTFAGSFPAGGFTVVFKDHKYTPDKDGPVVGYTWHWDSIAIT